MKPKETLKMTKYIMQSRKAVDDLNWRQNIARASLGVLFDRSDCVVTFSKKIADQLALVGTSTPVEIIPIGSDPLAVSKTDREKWRNKWQVKNNDTVFIYVGRIAPEKNLELLVESFKNVLEKLPTSKLVIVGGFFYQDELKRQVNNLGLDKYVIFTGRIDRHKLGGVYGAADIFCFPSLTDTQALVLNEASLAKLPMIWCDDNLNEVLIDKKTGLKAQPNPTDFTAKMITLATNPKMLKKYGNNAHQVALGYSELEQSKKLADLFIKYNKLH